MTINSGHSVSQRASVSGSGEAGQPHLYGYVHGFGVGPEGAKYKLMQRYLADRKIAVHPIGWHVPNFAQTTTTGALDALERYFEKHHRESGGKTWNVVASSYGAYLVATLSSRRPELFNKLILLSPAFDT